MACCVVTSVVVEEDLQQGTTTNSMDIRTIFDLREEDLIRIWVKSRRGVEEVTYDESNDHTWSYHAFNTFPHITELFHVTNKDNHEVQIFGYLPPKTDGKQIKWILSVREDLRNESVETFPTFRPFEEGETSDNDTVVHKTFTAELNGNWVALNFVTENGDTYYLVPSAPSRPKKVRTRKTNDAQYVFQVRPADS